MAPRLVGAPVGGDALATVEELDGVGGVPGEELASGQGVGDGGVVAVELDVGIDVHTDLLPLGEDVGLGGERAQRRTVDGLEGAAPRAGELVEGARVEPPKQPGDGAVELGEGEEGAVAQCGENPALDELDGDPRFPHSEPAPAGSKPGGRPRPWPCRGGGAPAPG